MKWQYLFVIVFIFAACGDEEKTPETQVSVKPFKISSTSFDSGAVIPDKFSCVSGSQVFPNLSWNTAGKTFKSYVLIMDDPDAVPVAGYVWNHWLLYDIPATTTSIGEGTSLLNPLPSGTKRGQTSFGDTAYGGPCPPSGQLHHYIIKVYGMDVSSIGLSSGMPVATVRQAMKNHILDSATYSGTFQR